MSPGPTQNLEQNPILGGKKFLLPIKISNLKKKFPKRIRNAFYILSHVFWVLGNVRAPPPRPPPIAQKSAKLRKPPIMPSPNGPTPILYPPHLSIF